ncbi:MAG: patatin-like phospholipase family protein [Eubacteriales bacterium]|jgi:NTE family protein
MKIGLALSGGEGMACYIGVLRILRRANIEFDMISGVSTGAVVAALWAAGYTAEELECRLQYGREKSPHPLAQRLSEEHLAGQMAQLLEEKNIYQMEQFPIPVAIPAVDLSTGKTVYFVSRKESLLDSQEAIFRQDVEVARAVRASLSCPVALPPIPIQGMQLVDGGLREAMPVTVLKTMGADRVLALRTRAGEPGKVWGPVQAAARSLEIVGRLQQGERYADYVLEVVPPADERWARGVRAGEVQAEQVLPDIEKALYE